MKDKIIGVLCILGALGLLGFMVGFDFVLFFAMFCLVLGLMVAGISYLQI